VFSADYVNYKEIEGYGVYITSG